MKPTIPEVTFVTKRYVLNTGIGGPKGYSAIVITPELVTFANAFIEYTNLRDDCQNLMLDEIDALMDLELLAACNLIGAEHDYIGESDWKNIVKFVESLT